ncbi:MAG TPA: hypothetical protein VHJ18_29965 [Streptosporangiaceae bacterium]|jgi:hypothetical protein|nr:hypothetical protein [Streptosporangiaceae bacterium]
MADELSLRQSLSIDNSQDLSVRALVEAAKRLRSVVNENLVLMETGIVLEAARVKLLEERDRGDGP